MNADDQPETADDAEAESPAEPVAAWQPGDQTEISTRGWTA